MKHVMKAGQLMLLDLASTVFFLGLFLLTGSLKLAVAIGILFGVAQIGWELARRRSIDTMQWVSLVIVVASGSAALLTHDPHFIMLKLSVIYLTVGTVMLKPGWLDRYQPPVAHELLPDVIVVFGYVWAGLMFASAVLNVAVALSVSVTAWAKFMSVFGIGSKLTLFGIQVVLMRAIGARRYRAGQAAAALPGE